MKKPRKTYDMPLKKYDSTRIKEEDSLKREFGLKNKKEIYKAGSIVRGFRRSARNLYPKNDPLSQKQKKELISSLQKMGIIGESATLDDVLTITTRDLLLRRLQTLVLQKGLAKTSKQARQLITHRHITVDGRIVTSPSLLVTKEKEDKINYAPGSAISNPAHPVRAGEKPKEEPEEKEDAPEKKEKKPEKKEKPPEKKKEDKPEKKESD